MLVKECMTKSVDLTSPDATLTAAANKMREGDFGALPVGENDRLVGMITDRDIVIRAVATGKDPNVTRVGDVMSAKILYCFEDESLEEASKSMAENQVKRMAVLNRQKRLVGIISLGDVALVDNQEASIALKGISNHSDKFEFGSRHQMI